VAIQTGPLAETILKQSGHERLGIGESDQAVAKIPRRQYTHLAPQLAGTSTVVSNSHDRCQTHWGFVLVVGVLFQATQ
jgi:hypothetical protein